MDIDTLRREESGETSTTRSAGIDVSFANALGISGLLPGPWRCSRQTEDARGSTWCVVCRPVLRHARTAGQEDVTSTMTVSVGRRFARTVLPLLIPPRPSQQRSSSRSASAESFAWEPGRSRDHAQRGTRACQPCAWSLSGEPPPTPRGRQEFGSPGTKSL